MAMRDEKVIIFDADGTLYGIKTAPAYSRLYRFLAGHTGLPERELKRRHTLTVAKVKDSRNPAVRSHLYAIRKLVVGAKLAKMAEAEFWKGVRVIKRPGTRHVLKELKRKGYRLAIASDEFSGHLARKMEFALGKNWKTHFVCIVTPESTGAMKPSARFYRLILKKLGLKAGQAMVVGNSWEKDLAPAAGMGLSTVLVSNKGEGKPDFFIRHISGLAGILGKWER